MLACKRSKKKTEIASREITQISFITSAGFATVSQSSLFYSLASLQDYAVVESISVTLPINQEQKTTNYVVYLEYATYTPLTQLHACYCKNTFELVNFSVLGNELLDKLVCLKLVICKKIVSSVQYLNIIHVLFTVF